MIQKYLQKQQLLQIQKLVGIKLVMRMKIPLTTTRISSMLLTQKWKGEFNSKLCAFEGRVECL